MTDEEFLAQGWTRQTLPCYACGHPTAMWVPPAHEPLMTPPRPAAEHTAAEQANDAIREATEDRKNRSY